jgi:hypothetical protein
VAVKLKGVQPDQSDSFSAEVELHVDKLDPNEMPLQLTGAFAPFDNPIFEYLLRTERTDGGYSHQLYFNEDSRRAPYRFTMTSGTTLDFTAVSPHLNPATGLPGFSTKLSGSGGSGVS